MNIRDHYYFAALCCILAALPYALSAQTNLMDSLRHDAKTRIYGLQLPPGYAEGADWPLVVFLHGGGGNSLSAQGFTRFNGVANERGFLVAYPQGFTAIDSASYVWADGRGTAADRDGVDDVGFIGALADALTDQYAVDPARIYVCGFSNGGFMTQRLACEANHRYAAMAGLGSIMDTARIKACAPGRAVPMLLLAGTDDPLVPFEGGEMTGSADVTPVVSVAELVAFWVENNGCAPVPGETALPDQVADDNSTARLFEYGGCDCGAALDFYQVDGGGHTWPGVELPAYELIAGETNEDIFASQVLWDFFSRFQRECPYDETTSRQPAPASGPPPALRPNPARDRAFVVSSAPVVSVRLYDGQGRKAGVFYGREIDLSGLAPGVYAARIQTQTRAGAHSRKIVVY